MGEDYYEGKDGKRKMPVTCSECNRHIGYCDYRDYYYIQTPIFCPACCRVKFKLKEASP